MSRWTNHNRVFHIWIWKHLLKTSAVLCLGNTVLSDLYYVAGRSLFHKRRLSVSYPHRFVCFHLLWQVRDELDSLWPCACTYTTTLISSSLSSVLSCSLSTPGRDLGSEDVCTQLKSMWYVYLLNMCSWSYFEHFICARHGIQTIVCLETLCSLFNLIVEILKTSQLWFFLSYGFMCCFSI